MEQIGKIMSDEIRKELKKLTPKTALNRGKTNQIIVNKENSFIQNKFE